MTVTPGAIDTPDFQHGVISAQKLLGVIAAGDLSLTVDVPVNAETVVAMIQNQASHEGAWCQGAASGMIYPSGAIVMSEGDTSTITVWFDVSAAVDEQVTVNLFTAATGPTSIYGDSAVHTTNDPLTVDVLHGAMPKNTNALYTIPTAPNTDSGDHPPTELILASGLVTNGEAALAGAPAGTRYRVFSLHAVAINENGIGYFYDNISGKALIFGWSSGPSFMSFLPSGLPLSEGAGVYFNALTTGLEAGLVVAYTEEAI